MISEREYLNRIGTAHRKRFAQFFTPEPIASFMTQWLMQGRDGSLNVLEPAFGLGVFSRELLSAHPEVAVTGYDIDETILGYARTNFPPESCNLHLRQEDYLGTSWEERYDGIVCNPPYLKFHDYDNGTYVPLVNARLHTKLNGFTNIYTLFLLKSIAQLNDGGRLAYIVPSEFLNADYGVEVKRALLESGTLRHVIIIDFTRCAFHDALTTACILLCQRGEATDAVRFSTVDDVAELDDALVRFQSVPVALLDPAVKWKQYYEPQQSEGYSHLVPFSTFAKVSRGIATGDNDYFTFNEAKRQSLGLTESDFIPCIAHSTDVKGNIFTAADFQSLRNAGRKVLLFNGCQNPLDEKVQRYIRQGEEAHVNERYLTRSRSPWYALEKRKPSPIWVSVFNRNGLRFVRNEAEAFNLTTFHCVYNTSSIDTDILFAYLTTDMAKEIFLDNSRQYGNGLVKFEPNDLNRGQVADLRLLTEEERQFVRRVYEQMRLSDGSEASCIRQLDDFFRRKYASASVRPSERQEAFHRTPKPEVSIRPSSKRKASRIRQMSFHELASAF